MKFTSPITDIKDIKKIEKYLYSKNERDYFLFHLGVNIGIRISDLIKLKVSDIINKSELVIIEGKTNKHKVIKINNKLQSDIYYYTLQKNDNDYLFKSRKGIKHITRQQAYRIIKNAIEELNLNNKYDCVSVHSLRKTFAYFNMLINNNPIICAGLLNHSNTRNVQSYTIQIKKQQENFYI